MKTMIKAIILIILTLSTIACDQSARRVVLNVNGTKHEFQFDRSTTSDIIERLGKGDHNSEFVPIPRDKNGEGTLDERIYYKDLGVTFLLASHYPTTPKNVSTQTAVLWSIALDSTSKIAMDNLKIGMTQKEMESHLGPWKRLDGPSDSTIFYYKNVNLLFTATKDAAGHNVVKTMERIVMHSDDERR